MSLSRCFLPRLDAVGSFSLFASVVVLASVLYGQADSSFLITTVAGGGTVDPGDGGPATAARLNEPWGLAVDASGNLYIADSGNFRIRKVTSQGVITTVAGTGTRGFSGDGGPATAAMLSAPYGLAVDGFANLYVADGSRVRRITPGGIISTFAGNGTSGLGGDGGLATAAPLNAPADMAVDAVGNLYIIERNVGRLRKVTPAGIISTVTTRTGLGLGGSGVAVDASGNVYFANNRCGDGVNIYCPEIYRITVSGATSKLAGGGTGDSGDGGPATAAMLGATYGLAVDKSGNAYVADGVMNRVRELIPAPPTEGCIYSIDTNNQTFGTSGGGGSVAVLTNGTGCPWLAGSYVDWITVRSGTSGSGNGIVTYSVAPNTSSTGRRGTLWMAGKTLTVTQPGLTCSWSIRPRSVTVPSTGLIGNTVTVTANAPDCRWSARSNVPWILVSAGTSGTGGGAVTYTVGINTGGLRTGTMTIAGRTLYVNQFGPGDSISTLAGITPDGVVNAASYQPPIAPGSFLSIYGENFTDVTASWGSAIPDGKTLPTALGGVRVRINGKDCFIYYVQPTQINVLTPPDTATGPVDVDVTTDHGTATATATMAPVSPAWFTYTLQDALYPVALFANEYIYVAVEGALPGATSRPAKPGDYIQLYATGLGATNPPYPVGQVLTSVYPIADLSRVRVSVGGLPVPVLFAGITYPGLFQINIQVPDGTPDGDLPVVLQIDGQSTQKNAVLTFRR